MQKTAIINYGISRHHPVWKGPYTGGGKMSGKIMCIDDSPTIRMLVKKTLSPRGFDIIEADNGETALNQLVPEISIFIVDVNMPVMDGFTFVSRLKTNSDYAKKPVIFLTTESSSEKKLRGKELGINGWIVKPFEPDSLIKVIDMLSS
jgi:two-component system chemotaxis response regulator CheY